MTFLITHGRFWNRFFPEGRELGVETHTITACFSTPCFGFCARGLRGGICRPIMGTGKILIADSAGGGIKGSGSNYSKS